MTDDKNRGILKIAKINSQKGDLIQKKATRFLSATVLAMFLLSFCFLFAGCSAKIEGTYKFSSMHYSEGGMDLDIKVGEQFMGAITLNEDFCVMTLNEDGSVVATISAFSMGDESETQVGTWVKGADKTVVITFDGESQTCECDGKTLSFEEDGMKMTLKKK